MSGDPPYRSTSGAVAEEVVRETTVELASENVVGWKKDVEFAQWGLELKKVPDRLLSKMHGWFRWNDTRASAVFEDAECKKGAGEFIETAQVPVCQSDSAAAWAVADGVFASFYWEEDTFGGFIHDVCRAGGVDVLRRYLGDAAMIDWTDLEKLRGSRLWLQPDVGSVRHIVSKVEEAWKGVQHELSATLVLPASVAQSENMRAHKLWELKVVCKAGAPLMKANVVGGKGCLECVSQEAYEFWQLSGTPPILKVPGVLPLEDAIELEKQDKLASAPKNEQEAMERE